MNLHGLPLISLPLCSFALLVWPWRPTPFGLPKGSVLGPLLYILFTADIGPLLAFCSLASHACRLERYQIYCNTAVSSAGSNNKYRNIQLKHLHY